MTTFELIIVLLTATISSISLAVGIIGFRQKAGTDLIARLKEKAKDLEKELEKTNAENERLRKENISLMRELIKLGG